MTGKHSPSQLGRQYLDGCQVTVHAFEPPLATVHDVRPLHSSSPKSACRRPAAATGCQHCCQMTAHAAVTGAGHCQLSICIGMLGPRGAGLVYPLGWHI